MLPPPAALSAGTALRVPRNALVRLTVRQAVQSSSATSSTGAVGPAVPALLTMMSKPPSWSMAESRKPSSAVASPTSQIDPARPGMLALADSNASASRSQITIRAPAAANSSAVLRPIPAPPAVMIARLPVRSSFMKASPGQSVAVDDNRQPRRPAISGIQRPDSVRWFRCCCRSDPGSCCAFPRCRCCSSAGRPARTQTTGRWLTSWHQVPRPAHRSAKCVRCLTRTP
jgi:hypothetical protein